MNTAENPFLWEPQPEAAGWVQSRLDAFTREIPPLSAFAKRLGQEAAGRLTDWTDLLCCADAPPSDLGFQLSSDGTWTHPKALLPSVRQVRDNAPTGLLLRVDAVDDFVLARGDQSAWQIHGSPLDLRRTAVQDIGPSFWGATERHGVPAGTESVALSDDQKLLRILWRERLRLRPRHFETTAEAFRHLRELLDAAAVELGRNLATAEFFRAERDYWMSRNAAGRRQYALQNALGLGWGNQDHHTYRSSRREFAPLIAFFESLGFRCRERFYAGRDAGWGAQVLDHPEVDVTIFADVDLTPEEIQGDIAHEPLPESADLGTIGLWCALHGEALFQAGMHHLECQFDFTAARRLLQDAGVSSMKPFTDFAHLRQCFTEGERWPVEPTRLNTALQQGWITQVEADVFAREGALGSHFEILERNDGYCGFNQTGISEIIRDTDPRRARAETIKND